MGANLSACHCCNGGVVADDLVPAHVSSFGQKLGFEDDFKGHSGSSLNRMQPIKSDATTVSPKSLTTSNSDGSIIGQCNFSNEGASAPDGEGTAHANEENAVQDVGGDAGTRPVARPDSTASVGTEQQDDSSALLDEANEAANQCQLARALKTYETALRCRKQGSPQAQSAPDHMLDRLADKMQRVESMRKACSPEACTGKGWKKFDLESLTLWRCWDDKTGNLKLVMQWESPGSLQQMVASLRDSDVCEAAWDGGCWEMQNQQCGGATLARWLQKDPFSGKKTEVMLDRVLCDCLDDENQPCWVLLERAPQIEGFETFAGQWGGFNIKSVPEGYTRAIAAESGRVCESVGEDKCRCTMVIDFKIPSFVRWLLTDSLLQLGVSKMSKATGASWEKIISGWSDLGFDDRMRENKAFYDPVIERIKTHLEKQKTHGS